MEESQIMIIDAISYQPDMEGLMRQLHIRPGSRDASDLAELAHQAQTVARPKVMVTAEKIAQRGKNYVEIAGHTFTSRVLAVNLKNADEVYGYVATCGIELEAWANTLDDMLAMYWGEAIREAAVGTALKALDDALSRLHPSIHLSTMHPGSLADWPLAEQRPLFDLLGNVKGAIGVELTDSLLMVPTKSVSGITFPVTEDYHSCQLCEREGCPNRQAPYDPMLYIDKYQP